MRAAYFAVGEEVLLVSKNCPELNGEAVVIERSTGQRVNRANGELLSSPWGYTLSIETPTGIRWNESALRKKHKPSEFTFEQIINQRVPVDG